MPNGQPLAPRSSPAVLLAARFLFPFDDATCADNPNWRRAGRWLVLWGIVIGIGYALVFRLSWRWFGEYQYIRWMPAAAVLALDLGLCGYRLVVGAANVASRRADCPIDTTVPLSAPGLVMTLLVAIAKYALLLSLPIGRWHAVPAAAWDQAAWAARLGPLYPDAVYRPLVLMPLWGRWAIMLAAAVGRTAPSASARLRSMAAGTPLALILGWWVLIAALTAFYCSGSSEHLARGLAIPLGVMVASYLASFLLARRFGGQTEATVVTAGLVAEMAFLALYVPVASSIYWY